MTTFHRHYIVKTPQGFAARVMVPRHLRAFLQKSSLKTALPVRDPILAIARAQTFAARCREVFREAEQRMANEHERKGLAAGLAATEGGGDIRPWEVTLADGTRVKAEGKEDTEHALAFVRTQGEEHRKTLQAQAEYDRQAAELEHERKAPLQARLEAELAARTEEMRQFREDLARRDPNPAPVAPAPQGPTLRQAFRDYFTTWEAQMGRASVKKYKQAAALALVDFGADTRVDEITPQMAAKWLRDLQAPRQEITGRGKVRTRSRTPLTAKHFNTALRQIWIAEAKAWGVEGNPWDGQLKIKKTYKQTRRAEGRTAEKFDRDQLAKIFAPSNLERTRKVWTRWGLVLGLYTGARVGEIAQMYCRDIRDIDGTWCWQITDESAGQHLKTPACKRLLPIHPDLIALGLLDFVTARKAAGCERVWDVDLDRAAGIGATISQNVSYYLQEIIGLKTKKEASTLGEHGLRGTLVQHLQAYEMKAAGDGRPVVSADLRQAWQGRETRSNATEAEHYGRAYTVAEFQVVNQAIDWSAGVIDIPALRPLLAIQSQRNKRQDDPGTAYAQARRKQRAEEAKARRKSPNPPT